MDPEGQPNPFEPENWAQNQVEPKKPGWVCPHYLAAALAQPHKPVSYFVNTL
jgi:hypothetical protein